MVPYLTKIFTSATTLLGGVAGFLGIISLCILMISRPVNSLPIKLLGSILILSLAFFANNWFVYVVAIFIIATLVTDLEFLEKLAALAWNRKEYWEYLRERASKEDIRKKYKEEFDSEQSADDQSGHDSTLVAFPPQFISRTAPADQKSEYGGSTSEPNPEITDKFLRKYEDYLDAAFAFEKAVVAALKDGKGPFNSTNIDTRIKIRGARGVVVIDAIIADVDIHYLIEIKHSIRPHSLLNAAHQLQRYRNYYAAYLAEKEINVMTVPIVVVPSKMKGPNVFNGIFVLKFNEENSIFTNEGKVQKRLAQFIRNTDFSADDSDEEN